MLESKWNENQEKLTERQHLVLTLLERGATYLQISWALRVGIGTVKQYVQEVRIKMDVGDMETLRAHLAKFGVKTR